MFIFTIFYVAMILRKEATYRSRQIGRQDAVTFQLEFKVGVSAIRNDVWYSINIINSYWFSLFCINLS